MLAYHDAGMMSCSEGDVASLSNLYIACLAHCPEALGDQGRSVYWKDMDEVLTHHGELFRSQQKLTTLETKVLSDMVERVVAQAVTTPSKQNESSSTKICHYDLRTMLRGKDLTVSSLGSIFDELVERHGMERSATAFTLFLRDTSRDYLRFASDCGNFLTNLSKQMKRRPRKRRELVAEILANATIHSESFPDSPLPEDSSLGLAAASLSQHLQTTGNRILSGSGQEKIRMLLSDFIALDEEDD